MRAAKTFCPATRSLLSVKGKDPILTPLASIRDGALMKEKIAPLPPVLDKEQFGERWSISTRSVDRLIDQGLPVVKLGHRTVRIVPCSADAWLVKKFGRK